MPCRPISTEMRAVPASGVSKVSNLVFFISISPPHYSLKLCTPQPRDPRFYWLSASPCPLHECADGPSWHTFAVFPTRCHTPPRLLSGSGDGTQPRSKPSGCCHWFASSQPTPALGHERIRHLVRCDDSVPLDCTGGLVERSSGCLHHHCGGGRVSGCARRARVTLLTKRHRRCSRTYEQGRANQRQRESRRGNHGEQQPDLRLCRRCSVEREMVVS